jgi:hypothetical protein
MARGRVGTRSYTRDNEKVDMGRTVPRRRNRG